MLFNELFDLENDVSEENDLAAQRPAVARRLLVDLQGWIEETGADLSIDSDTGQEIVSPREFAETLPRP